MSVKVNIDDRMNALTALGWLPPEAVKALKEQVPPSEYGQNRYGVDMAYFRGVINRELNRPLVDFRPDELARVFARLSRTADPDVMHEPEFQRKERD